MYQAPDIVEQEIEYPESDGEPMAETDTHRRQMTEALIHPLQQHFRDRPDVYVSGNLFLYYEEGNPRAVVAPDVFVVFGVPKHDRRIYKLWEEREAPAVVFELTSPKTYQTDLHDKRQLYARLGVREYFLFDPLRELLYPPLQGFRLEEERYIPLRPGPFGDDDWTLESDALGLVLRTAGTTLRLYDPVAEQYLLTGAEEAEARRTAEAKAAREAAARRDAESEIARLRALLEQQEGKDE